MSDRPFLNITPSPGKSNFLENHVKITQGYDFKSRWAAKREASYGFSTSEVIAMLRISNNPKTIRHAVSVLASVAILLPIATSAKAGQQCWAWKEVRSAHEKQGDEVLAMFRSWIRDGAYTVIFHDPADGVVTEVTVLGAGVACIYDVGKRIRDYPGSSEEVHNFQ